MNEGAFVIEYKVKYLDDHQAGRPDRYESDHPLQVGDVVELDDFHCVCNIQRLQTIHRIDVARGCESEQEAILEAEYSGRL